MEGPDIGQRAAGVRGQKYELAGEVNWLHWVIVLGVKLEVPRRTKHSFYRWVVKVRFLCFGLIIARKNENRVPKIGPQADLAS